jgi:hypothetical protein
MPSAILASGISARIPQSARKSGSGCRIQRRRPVMSS